MPRGGKREGAGGKSAWKNGRTKPIRVPVVLAEKILEVARIIDRRGIEVVEALERIDSSEANSGVIDLTGIVIRSTKEGPAVYLADLIKAGYIIKPDILAQSLGSRRESRLSALKRQLDETIDQLKRLDGEA